MWKNLGFDLVLFAAAIQAIPEELYEASSMDGASGFQDFLHITLPQLRPILLLVSITAVIRSFQVFDTVEALTRGGPSKSTYVMVYAMFETGVRQNLLGIGSAITMVFLAFVLILTLTQVYFVNRRVHYS